MLSFSSILGFAILFGAAKCSPTPLEALDQLASKKTFTLTQVEVHRKAPRYFADEVTRTYLKYGVEPPSYIQAAIRAGGPGQASAPASSIEEDKEYLMQVQVGNHNLTLDLDTGSADLYVLFPSRPCNSRSIKQQITEDNERH
jgi:aspergillopepsin I